MSTENRNLNINPVISPKGSARQVWLYSLNMGFAITYSLFDYAANGRVAVNASITTRSFLNSFEMLLFRIAPLGTNQPHSVLSRNLLIWEIVFIVTMLGLGALLYPFFHIVSQALGENTLRLVSGISVFVAVPGFWLYVVHATWNRYDSGTFWHTYALMSAVEVTSAGFILYVIRTRPIMWSILIFVLYYLVWIVEMGRRSGIPVLVSIPASLVFPFAGIEWLRYVRLRQPSTGRV